jgi:hypothetical protein
VGVAASVGILSLGSIRWVAAQSGLPNPPPIPLPDADFLDLSQKLTGYFDLDPLTATRVSAGFARIDPALFARITALIPLARANQDPPALMKAVKAAGLDAAAQALTTTWYTGTGTVGTGSKAEVVAYADALMAGAGRHRASDILFERSCVVGPTAAAGGCVTPRAANADACAHGWHAGIQAAIKVPVFNNGDMDADLVIEGAGIVGATIADQLVSEGHSVVTLDAGPRLDRGQMVEN